MQTSDISLDTPKDKDIGEDGVRDPVALDEEDGTNVLKYVSNDEEEEDDQGERGDRGAQQKQRRGVASVLEQCLGHRVRGQAWSRLEARRPAAGFCLFGRPSEVLESGGC